MKKIILFIVFYSIAYSQHFTENFNSFLIDTSVTANWIEDSTWIADNTGTIVTDHGGSHTLTANGTPTTYVTGSPIYNGGKVIKLDGTNDHFYIAAASAGDFNPGLNSFTFGGWFYFYNTTGGSIYMLNKRSGTPYWVLRRDHPTSTVFIEVHDGSTQKFETADATTATGVWIYVVAVIDRSANQIKMYMNGTLQNSPTDITGHGTYTNANNLGLGVYGGNAGTSSSYPLYIAQAFYDATLWTANKVKASGYLADGWVSKQYQITRASATSFAQGISGSGLQIKVGSGSYVSQTLTASSVTYSMNLGAVNLSSDSIFVATNTDTLSHALADSTLPDGYQWTLSIDAQETGGVVYVDNLSLTTSLIPTDTETQDKGFKEHSKFKRFKSLK